jgi:hypothetical protein
MASRVAEQHHLGKGTSDGAPNFDCAMSATSMEHHDVATMQCWHEVLGVLPLA